MNKPLRTFSDILSFCYIGVSLFGLCLLAILTFNFTVPMVNLPFQKQLAGSLFIAICLIGIMAGFSPSRCSRILHFRSQNKHFYKEENNLGIKETSTRFMGHHPTCGKFSAHILRFIGKTCCAGCTGLVVGAVISLFGSFLYFFAGFHLEEASFIFWLGFVCVASGLLQYNLKLNNGPVHFFLNVLFVFGAFLLLVGVNGINGSFVVDFYLLTLIIFWITTRIMLSQLEHKRICATCDLKCVVPF